MKKHYTLTAVIGSVLLLAGCVAHPVTSPNSLSELRSDAEDVSSAYSAPAVSTASTVSTDPLKINGNDIHDAIIAVKQSISNTVMSNTGDSIPDDELARNVRNAAVYDLDFDGTDELLIASTFSVPYIHVFKKSSGSIEETTSFLMQPYSYMNDRLEMKPYENGDEKYYYFTFCEGNGVMKATVLGAVKPSGDSYEIEYLYSWGTLEYPDIAEPVTNEFYRTGWDRSAVTLGADDPNDISKETLAEALKVYNITI